MRPWFDGISSPCLFVSVSILGIQRVVLSVDVK